jgi:MFS family permease
MRSRKAMTFIAGYATHNFELFGLRSWLVAFLAFAASLQPAGAAVWSPAAVAALITLVGVPASIFGNELAVKMGRRREIMLMMALAAIFAGTIGFAAGLPYPLLVALMLFYSLCIAGDSAALTAGAIAAAPEGYRGATMAVHSSLGFGFGFLGSVTVGAALDVFGKTTPAGWGWSFATMAAMGLAGLAAVWWLGRER